MLYFSSRWRIFRFVIIPSSFLVHLIPFHCICLRFLSARCKYYFDSMLAQRGYTGSMTFDHRNETLSISVRTTFDTLASFSFLCNACELWVTSCVFSPEFSSKPLQPLALQLLIYRRQTKRYSTAKQFLVQTRFLVRSSVGAAGPGKQGWLEWHALPVWRRALLLDCLLCPLSLGHHRGAFPLPWRVWCLHGKKSQFVLTLAFRFIALNGH